MKNPFRTRTKVVMTRDDMTFYRRKWWQFKYHRTHSTNDLMIMVNETIAKSYEERNSRESKKIAE